EAVARVNGWKGPMRDLPLDLAKQIYKQQYWINPRFDQVNTLQHLPWLFNRFNARCNKGFAKATPQLTPVSSNSSAIKG
ncbi:glycosyl hydrolase 108 family protein, partial [Bacillus sp. D-CC]